MWIVDALSKYVKPFKDNTAKNNDNNQEIQVVSKENVISIIQAKQETLVDEFVRTDMSYNDFLDIWFKICEELALAEDITS